MILASDLAVCRVSALGGLAPVDVLEDAIAVRIGRLAAERGVSLAVLSGRLEEVRMVDGSAGLRLVRAER